MEAFSPLLPLLCEMVVPEVGGAFLGLVVGMAGRPRQEGQAPGALQELAGVLWDPFRDAMKRHLSGEKGRLLKYMVTAFAKKEEMGLQLLSSP